MKIRLKRDHSREINDVFMAYRDHIQTRWELSNGEGSYLSYLSSHWEPVPEERWENVTEQMQHSETVCNKTYFHGNIDVLTMAEGYRLRKVHVVEHIFHDWAFIIERKCT